MSTKNRLSSVVVLALVIAACGGGAGGGSTTTTPGTGPTTTTGGVTTTGGSQTTVTQPSSGDEGAVNLEIDGIRYELSVRDDIPIAGVPDTTFPTRCSPSSFGAFWVIAVELDTDGTYLEEGWQLGIKMYPSGEIEERGFAFENDEVDVRWWLDQDDPGSWTVSGNRIQGEVNIYDSNGNQDPTVAKFDVTCAG